MTSTPLTTIKRAALRALSLVLPYRLSMALLRRWTRALKQRIEGQVTDKFLELLLDGMALAFCLLRSYRRNIAGFNGAYTFRTADGQVAAAALFRDGVMRVRTRAVAPANVTVSFRDAAGLRRFLLSEDQDILASILANDVQVDGNLSYIYKFGFMARDLMLRLAPV